MAEQKTPEQLEAERIAAEELATAESKKTEIMIPKARFDEVNKKAQDLQKELDAKKLADKEAEEKRLKEQNDYKTLSEKQAADLLALQKQAEADKADAEAKAKKTQYESSVIANASKLNFADPQDAVRLLGEVEDVEAGLRKLVEEKPYLLKTNKTPPHLSANKVKSGAAEGGGNPFFNETSEERDRRLLG